MEEYDEEAIKHFELLKISILARIDDYDEFYKRHFLDPRISFFEKQKYRLRRLIYESENGKNRVVKPQTPEAISPVLKHNSDKSAGHNYAAASSLNEVVVEVKLNKNEFARIQNQKVKGKAK